MKYIIIALLIQLLAIIWLAERDKQSQQDTLQQQKAKIDSLQAIVDNCDSRVNDMRLQRDHAIETNRWHKQRWNEMIRVRP